MLESFVIVKEGNRRFYTFVLSSPARSLNPVYTVRSHYITASQNGIDPVSPLQQRRDIYQNGLQFHSDHKDPQSGVFEARHQ